jgi:acetamidase/formamidase
MDAGIRAIFDKVMDRGPGPHILTGPIHVDGARPGDTLAVRIVDATPLANPIGLVLDVTAQRREPALRAVDVPLRPHFGVLPAPPLPAP